MSPPPAPSEDPRALVRTEARTLVRLAMPLIAGQLATIGMNTVDVLMAGRLSADALAAVAVGGSVWSATLVFCLGVLLALPPSVSHLVGAGRTAEVGGVLGQGLWVAMALAAVSIVLLANLEPLLVWVHVEPAIVPTVVGYLRAVSWGVPGVYGYLTLRFLSEGLGHTRPAMYFGFTGLAVNVLGNWLLMYGHWGFPALGAVGCGYATAAVFWVQLAAMVVYVSSQRRYREAQLAARLPRPDWPALGELLRVGAPIGVAVFIELCLFSGAALLLGSISAHVVAGHQVALNFAAVTFMVPLGIAMATTVRVAHAAGRGDGHGVRRAAGLGMALALASQVVSASLMLLFPRTIAGLYSRDPQVVATAVELLFVAAFFQLSDGVQVSAAGALRGLKDTRWPMLFTFVAYWVVGLPTGYWLCFGNGLGPRGMWMGLIAGLTVAGALLALRFQLVSRRLLPVATAEPAAG